MASRWASNGLFLHGMPYGMARPTQKHRAHGGVADRRPVALRAPVSRSACAPAQTPGSRTTTRTTLRWPAGCALAPRTGNPLDAFDGLPWHGAGQTKGA